ncbi:hypothetical protein ACFFSW_29030 [Saccharothrix longispora]|uniref:Na+/melibiose symporter-like transporter n=1 Tax=Saccharothrix longispora TaxID=33920 RepID=A0ABU1PRT5_9PSEU|nr:hypothetical protein [Saccharothrix longispora]MDR6593356.1 Na+/melibiose symporter-like transporter [Saccharothrix longispora]
MAGSASRKFGRIDPFILFLVVPMLLIAGVMVWGGLAWVGVVVVVFALLVLLLDSWTNRPLPFEVPEDDYDYDEPPHRGGRRY